MPLKIIKRQINKNPKIHGPKAFWSDKQRLEAVTTYLLVGKLVLVSDATGIPFDTLKRWKAAPWWKEMEDEVRHSSNIEMSASMKRIRDKAIKEVEDRLENGDFHINPTTGVVSRRPINAKVASEIMVKTIDKEILLQKLEEKPRIQQEEISERLKTIEAFLIKGARKPKIIDVEVIDGEELQEGERTLQIEAGADQSEGGEEQGSEDHDRRGVSQEG